MLVDAGISARQAALRLQQYGRDIRNVKLVLLSHEHADHVRCAGVFQRKFRLPVALTPGTHRAGWRYLESLEEVEHFSPGDTIEVGPLCVHSIPTEHDAVEGCAFVFEAEGRRLGLFTDLGHVFPRLRRWMAEVDAAFLESNFDPELLQISSYPPDLKRRIQGPSGHISNDEAAALVAEVGCERLQWLMLAHLSQENNTPERALTTHRQTYGHHLPLYVASRTHASELLFL